MDKDLKMQLNADLITVGDRIVHPLDLQVHKVKSIQRSFGHMDYLDFGFENVPMISVWKTTHITVLRRATEINQPSAMSLQGG